MTTQETDDRLLKALKFEDGIKKGKFTVLPGHVLDAFSDIVYKGEERGVSTGWYNLDQFYRVKKGELCIVTGVPSHGKSEFVDALMMNLAVEQGWKFAMYSPENKPFARHLRKLVEKYAGKPVRVEPKVEGDKPLVMKGEELTRAIEFVHNHFRWVDLVGESTCIANLTEWFAFEILENKIDGVLIDPWGDIEHKRPGKWSETEYISFMLTHLREFARLHNVAFWIIAHPKMMQRGKDGNFPKPTMWDISGSAHWRNRADVGICVYRQDLRKHEVEIDVQKVRFKSTGTPGSAFFTYDWGSGRFAQQYAGG